MACLWFAAERKGTPNDDSSLSAASGCVVINRRGADGDRRATAGQQKLLATSLPRCDICIKLVWESAIAVRLSASRVASSAAVRYLVSPVSVVKPSRVRKSDCWLAKLQSTQVSPSFFQRTGPKSKRRSSFMAYVYKVEYLQ